MVMAASGAISCSDIQTEHGGINPVSLSEYYGSDDYYLPQSGIIAMSDFYNSTPETVAWTTAAFSTSQADDPRPLAGIVLNSDGGLYEYLSGVETYAGQNWCSTYSSPRSSLYECKWVGISGSTTNWSAPTENAWQLLSSSQIFKYVASPPWDSTRVIDVYVRALNQTDTQVIKRVTISSALGSPL